MKLPTLEEFDLMCSQHDWYYMWSDDHSKYTKGASESSMIRTIVESGEEDYNQIYRKYLKENSNVG
jgi:hypothetical protein